MRARASLENSRDSSRRRSKCSLPWSERMASLVKLSTGPGPYASAV